MVLALLAVAGPKCLGRPVEWLLVRACRVQLMKALVGVNTVDWPVAVEGLVHLLVGQRLVAELLLVVELVVVVLCLAGLLIVAGWLLAGGADALEQVACSWGVSSLVAGLAHLLAGELIRELLLGVRVVGAV